MCACGVAVCCMCGVIETHTLLHSHTPAWFVGRTREIDVSCFFGVHVAVVCCSSCCFRSGRHGIVVLLMHVLLRCLIFDHFPLIFQ